MTSRDHRGRGGGSGGSPNRLPPEIVYSCEICGQDDLNDAEMRTHMETVHLKGALQCPFCDLSSHDVTANEMTLHVNSAHLEYLTPEREDVAFLEDYDSMSDFDSIWQLEKVNSTLLLQSFFSSVYVV